jgi:hypothetical protein
MTTKRDLYFFFNSVVQYKQVRYKQLNLKKGDDCAVLQLLIAGP